MNEESTLDKIFDSPKNLWKGIYQVSWCNLCEMAIISCPKCEATSCNCSSCESCHKDFEEFLKVKTTLEDYLNEREMHTMLKCRRIQKHILTCLKAGKPEIDWAWLHKEGHLCQHDYDLFDELKDFQQKVC